jgi:hypothetical protein
MTAAQLLSELARQGFTLIAEGDGIRVRPASRLTEELRQAVRRHKSELLVLLAGAGSSGPAPAPGSCPSCRRPLDAKARCWGCCNRACESCSRPTGSAFLALCLLCEYRERQ